MKSILVTMSVLFNLYNTAQSQEPKPTLKWKFQALDAIIGSPVIDGNAVYFSSLDKNLYAVNFQTGKQLWKFETVAPNRSTVLVSGEVLYFLSGDGNVYCLDKKTAKINWSFKTRGEKKYDLYSFADHFQSSPVLDGGILYFGSGDHNVYAVNAKSGKLVWQYKTGNVVHATPVIQNENLLIGSFDGYFYDLNKITGKSIWKFKSVGQKYFPLGEFQGSPAISGGTVYVGSRDFNFYALNIKKGICNWNHYFTRGWSIATPVFYRNMVINGTSDDRILAAMDTSSGAITWQIDAQFNIFGSCLVTDSTGFFGTLGGKLFAVNLNTGKIIWNYSTDGRQKYHNEYLTDNEKYNSNSIKLLTGDLAEQVPIFYKLGGIFSKPAKMDKFLVFSSSEGAVYCLKVK